MFDGRVVVTTIAQVSLNLVGVSFDPLQRQSSSRLKQIQARANLVRRDRSPGRLAHAYGDAGNDHLSRDDEANANGTVRAAGLNFRDFDAPVRDAIGGEQFVQRLSRRDCRVFTAAFDSNNRQELSLSRWIGGRAFEHNLDGSNGTAFVVADLSESLSGTNESEREDYTRSPLED